MKKPPAWGGWGPEAGRRSSQSGIPATARAVNDRLIRGRVVRPVNRGRSTDETGVLAKRFACDDTRASGSSSSATSQVAIVRTGVTPS
jgi:hypothetical protein